MRITGGKARGIQLQSPSKGQTRPATDYLREAVFASLGWVVNEARVLDCFAGTGAYALEAMSRGAHSATLIEQNAAAVRCIRANATAVAKSAGFDAALLDIRQADAVQTVKRLACACADTTPHGTSGQAASLAPAHTPHTDSTLADESHPTTSPYSLIFVDPPYQVWEAAPAALLEALAVLLRASAAANPRLVLEAPGQWTPPQLPGLQLLRHLKKGSHQPAALIYAVSA